MESSDLGGIGGTTYGILGNYGGNDPKLANVSQSFVSELH